MSLPVLVGRVDEHEVVTPPARLLLAQERDDVLAAHDGVRQAELLEVRRDDAARRTVVLDEDASRSTARERLEAHSTGAGEEVEYDCLVNGSDQRERRLADAISGRARDDALGRGDPVPLPRAGNDAHQPRGAARARAASPTRSRTISPAGLTSRKSPTPCPAHSDKASMSPVIVAS